DMGRVASIEKVQYYDIATEKRAEFDRAMIDYIKRKESGEDQETEDSDSEFDEDSNMSTCSNYSLKALASDVLCLPADASNELAILLTSAIIATTSLSLFTAEPTPCVHT
ncbi:high mobility group b protein 14, partial [Quercus suber]